MINNTEAFYVKAKEFQDKRAEMMEEYANQLKSLKRYEGSDGYEDDVKKIKKEHNEKLVELQNEYRRSLNTILQGMTDVLSRRTVTPPTNDQLNLIQLLKMREKVTQSELDRVAEMVKDNGIAIGVVQEVANLNGIIRNYQSMCDEMSTDYAQRIIKNVQSGLEDWIKYDTSRAERKANQYFHDKYGTPITPDIEMHKRPIFNDMNECYREMAGLTQEGLDKFAEAVNE